ncbi:hypothetical protein DM01DRAFT_1338481 [Hesseltinella vesiculosa]|uniref:Uncharacterized protein n=1 Tax=Hesseltinella vesiculosa TaxID=101127 RepID=A0A1X2G9Z1_9FUNG|nr:hypothetical protein DM01DRAFT_1338481 [Hesseltinella vesiculosa]
MPTTKYDLGYEKPAIFKIYDFMGASDSHSASPSLEIEEPAFVNIDYRQSRKDQRMLSAMQRCKIWISHCSPHPYAYISHSTISRWTWTLTCTKCRTQTRQNA